MRSLIILWSISFILISCKLAPSSTVKIENHELPHDTFVLEKESDFEKIGKDYIIYIKWNFGSRKINNDCNCPELEEKYILFKKDNKSHIQKVVGNAVYYPIKLKSNHIITLYSKSFSKFRNESVKKFGTMQGDQVFRSHSIIKQYILAIEQDRPITIKFYEEDFQKDSFDKINASYIHNKNLMLYKIDNLLNSEINELNKQDAFIFRICRKD
ncbi:hypothetical protein [Chryseobacterium luquanense]|uniref:Lipoprotein n=1 Tax=Chryseobacterium luquanense TaxID=2983766 RepID=A0ABT3Y5S6_9FLAO|nr:hypothetical protein [Chryseobacterium luquanense]MCX8533431.1 hypothetical protein [Chryseobacterium luquanense]